MRKLLFKMLVMTAVMVMAFGVVANAGKIEEIKERGKLIAGQGDPLTPCPVSRSASEACWRMTVAIVKTVRNVR